MLENIIVLLLAALPLMGSPGPATLSTAAVGSAYGAARGVPYLAGICAGTSTVLLIVASGITGVIFAVPGALPVITVAAAAYILFLAWKIATAPPLATRGEAGKAPSFVPGYLLAIANPKAYAAIGAVFSSVVVVEAELATDAVVKVVALTALVVAINTIWLLFGAAFARYLSSPRLGRAVNITFAVLLVVSVAAAVLG
ncbi:MAG: LysE family translocator [Alphaproteobacteria bacterium]